MVTVKIWGVTGQKEDSSEYILFDFLYLKHVCALPSHKLYIKFLKRIKNVLEIKNM